MEFAEALKAARAEAGISQVEMAKKLGVSNGTYADWELGTHRARIDRYDVIAEVLGKKVAKVLARQLLGSQAEKLLKR